MAIGYDCESFHGRRAEALGLATGEKKLNKPRVVGSGVDFPSFRSFGDYEGATTRLINFIKFDKGIFDFVFASFSKSFKVKYPFGAIGGWGVFWVLGNGIFREFGGTGPN